MTNETLHQALEHLLHIRGAVDRIDQKLDDFTACVGRLEIKTAETHLQLAKLSVQFDKVETSLTRVEKRLDLVEA